MIEVLPDAGALAGAVAEQVVAAALGAIAARGQFIVALAGGSTPRLAYERLAADPLASRVPWPRVHVLFGDERCVPPDDAQSNYRMAREALLDHVPIPPDNVHRIHAEDDPPAAATAYESALRALLGSPAGPPTAPGVRLDLVLLGLGDDGHTASLFPGSDAVAEPARWAVPAYSAATSTWRVTLTPPVINAAAEVLFIVSGASKSGILRTVLEEPHHPRKFPAQAIAPSSGRLRWYVDAPAAAALGTKTT